MRVKPSTSIRLFRWTYAGGFALALLGLAIRVIVVFFVAFAVVVVLQAVLLPAVACPACGEKFFKTRLGNFFSRRCASCGSLV